jgi:pimeloyl-ACP methyl ester carboxylesterase
MNRIIKAVLASGAALAGMAAVNALIEQNAPLLRSELEGETGYFDWRLGRVFYQIRGQGPPVLLIHGINAAASSYEMRRVYAGLSDRFRVYAIDLLGFGQSDRPPIRYRPDLYIDLIADFTRQVIGQPTHLIASSLSAALAVRAAFDHPDLFVRLVLVLPTGLERLINPPGAKGKVVEELFRSRLVGEFLFNLLTSQASIRYYVQQRAYFDGSLFTDAMLESYYATGHEPGARYAPAAFVSGHLNHDIRDVYSKLPQPVFIVWGQQAPFTPVENCQQFMKLKPGSKLRVFDCCRLLPHDEHADEFNQLVGNWLAEAT